MNIKPSWDTAPDMPEGGISNATPQEQQSPLDEVGNGASGSIIEALEEYTAPLFNNNPLHTAMLEMMGGCPVEIRRSVIDNATKYGFAENNTNKNGKDKGVRNEYKTLMGYHARYA